MGSGNIQLIDYIEKQLKTGVEGTIIIGQILGILKELTKEIENAKESKKK